KQERHIVAADIEIAMVDIGNVRQGVQLLQLGTIRVVRDGAVLAIGNSKNLVERLAVGEFFGRVVEFLADNEIDRRAIAQALLRQNRDVRADKSNLDLGIDVLNALGEANVAREPGCTG